MFGRKKSSPQSMRNADRIIKARRGPTSKYPKSYTVKEWKRFSPEVQQVLSNRYTVTLTDYKTKQEKMGMMKSNIKSGFKKGMNAMGKIEMGSGKSINYLDAPINIKSPNTLGMFDSGFGSKKKSGYFDDLAKF